MRLLVVAALLLPLTAVAASGNSKSNPFGEGKIVIKDEIVKKCGGFPYGPTIVVDAKAATIDEM